MRWPREGGVYGMFGGWVDDVMGHVTLKGGLV